ncbi:hypothetical protein SAMN06297387_13137 [Streptomyces zhaozhouensis]|uniref:FtsK domain-containing protein n=1 Tax=Streptomyces zhaozhouensis TaxID=1300267 RepID=A0A286E9B9_9ACTN|nr:transfer protein [Streptomyces zhaozhouensis]SOD67497.1 hypothetical protein SAMN06297387_13137 [Streptomyces zhaozhouensis]
MMGITATSGVRPRRLTDIGESEQVVELSLTAPKPGTKMDAEALAETLGVDDPTRLVIQTERRQVLVRVYPRSPLLETVPATVEDLTMDARGRIRIGRYYDESPVTWRLWDPITGSAQRGIIFGTTGAGKSRLAHAILIGCKRSGITTHLADLKSGQSVPEAVGQVATHVTTQTETIHMLRGLVARAQERERRYGVEGMGRSGFVRDHPDPLEYGIVEEANRLLERGAPYRREAAQLIRELGRTGRSVGIGIILLAQAGHLEELGGSDTLRAMLREGEVILLRWSSGIMSGIVSGGLLPPGTRLTLIPKVLGRVPRITRYGQTAPDDDTDANSQGCGYHLTSARPEAMMRALMIGSLTPHPGHDPAILALYGDGPPPGRPIPIPDTPVRPTPGEIPPDPDEDHDADEAGYDEEDQEQEQPATAAPPPVPAGPRTIAQRITTALAAAGGTATTGDLLAALAADGGREVGRGSLDNTLRAMRRKSAITSASGTHTLTNRS